MHETYPLHIWLVYVQVYNYFTHKIIRSTSISLLHAGVYTESFHTDYAF